MSIPGVPSMASVSQITSTLLKQIYAKTSKGDEDDDMLPPLDGNAPLALIGTRGSAHAANIETNHGYLLGFDSDSGSADKDTDDSDEFATSDCIGSLCAKDCDLASDATTASIASIWSRMSRPEEILDHGIDKIWSAVDRVGLRCADKLEQKFNGKASYVAKVSSATQTKASRMADEKGEELRGVVAEQMDRGKKVLDYATVKFDFAAEKVNGGIAVVAERSRAISQAAQTKSGKIRSKTSGSIETLRSRTVAAKGILFQPI